MRVVMVLNCIEVNKKIATFAINGTFDGESVERVETNLHPKVLRPQKNKEYVIAMEVKSVKEGVISGLAVRIRDFGEVA